LLSCQKGGFHQEESAVCLQKNCVECWARNLWDRDCVRMFSPTNTGVLDAKKRFKSARELHLHHMVVFWGLMGSYGYVMSKGCLIMFSLGLRFPFQSTSSEVKRSATGTGDVSKEIHFQAFPITMTGRRNLTMKNPDIGSYTFKYCKNNMLTTLNIWKTLKIRKIVGVRWLSEPKNMKMSDSWTMPSIYPLVEVNVLSKIWGWK